MTDLHNPSRAPGAISPRTPERPRKDGTLVAAIALSDSTALAEAYAQHASQVYSVAQSLCGGTRAEDLTQEIFLQLWRNPQRYDAQDGSLRSFLLRQAHRCALDVLRTNEAWNAREAAESDGAVLALVDRAAVSSFVTALPENERQPIVLAYFGGHTYREVARILGLSDGTVKSLVRSGLERLRTSLASATRLD